MSFLEIERKFLVCGEFRDKAVKCYHIEQGYIACDRGRSVRVRIRDTEGFITIKGPSDQAGLSHFEFEKPVTLEEAHQLMSICLPGRIVKERYLVPNGPHTVEVDVFHEENEGLVVAEIELNSEDEDYIRPDFLGKEVTDDHRYKNTYLSVTPYTLWPQQDR